MVFVCNAGFPLIGGSRDKVHLHVINLADRAKIFFPFDVELLDLHASARKTGGIFRGSCEKIRDKMSVLSDNFLFLFAIVSHFDFHANYAAYWSLHGNNNRKKQKPPLGKVTVSRLMLFEWYVFLCCPAASCAFIFGPKPAL